MTTPDLPHAREGSRLQRRIQRALADARRDRTPGKAGRDLPAAIGVGVALATAIVGTLVWDPRAFLALVAAAIVVGMTEVVRAVRHGHVRVPVIPTVVGGLAMLLSAYAGGPRALTLAFTLALGVVVVWRTLLGVRDAMRDVGGAALTLAYVPLLASFCIMLLAQPSGELKVVTFIAVTVFSDIGGYAVGVLKGKHPMAPSVSPKKSWEGFAGSMVTCMVVGAVCVGWLLHAPWWAGLLLGAGACVTATVGDLCESVIKRDLGIKDMGHILPGHGGIMDRLDSLLLTAPMCWLVITYLG
ncbi:phosphatidate cytidylyltransferase [Arsenicicoccus dermatophilus]|uniref:phosphatidate cytidylyltransferase n=1 Tax=Arsenicicoccus dermatophilus TaxID=1076331 RepID=UPI00391732F5